MGDITQFAAVGHYGVKDARAVDVQRQVALAGKRPGFLQIVARQHFTVVGVSRLSRRVGAKWISSGLIFAATLSSGSEPSAAASIGCG